MLINTVFSWIVTGKVSEVKSKTVTCWVASASDCLEAQLHKFWKIESNEDRSAWSNEEQDSKNYFLRTFSRTEEGRYVVRLPKHVNLDQMLEDSRTIQKIGTAIRMEYG